MRHNIFTLCALAGISLLHFVSAKPVSLETRAQQHILDKIECRETGAGAAETSLCIDDRAHGGLPPVLADCQALAEELKGADSSFLTAPGKMGAVEFGSCAFYIRTTVPDTEIVFRKEALSSFVSTWSNRCFPSGTLHTKLVCTVTSSGVAVTLQVSEKIPSKR